MEERLENVCYIVICLLVSQVVYKVVDEKVEGKFTEFHNVGDMADIYILVRKLGRILAKTQSYVKKVLFASQIYNYVCKLDKCERIINTWSKRKLHYY